MEGFAREVHLRSEGHGPCHGISASVAQPVLRPLQTAGHSIGGRDDDVETLSEGDVWRLISSDQFVTKVARELEVANPCLVGLMPNRVFQEKMKAGRQLRGATRQKEYVLCP